MCEICSKLTIKTPEQHYYSVVSSFDFEQVNAGTESVNRGDVKFDSILPLIKSVG